MLGAQYDVQFNYAMNFVFSPVDCFDYSTLRRQVGMGHLDQELELLSMQLPPQLIMQTHQSSLYKICFSHLRSTITIQLSFIKVIYTNGKYTDIIQGLVMKTLDSFTDI